MSTNFSGDILLHPPLNEHEISYLEDFFNTRHVTYNHGRLLQVADLDPNDVTDCNQVPAPMPSLWCDWMVDRDGDYLTHNGEDDSYHLDTWLVFLLTHLLAPEDDQALIHTHRGDDPRLKHFVPHIAHGVITAISGDPHDMWTLCVGDLGEGFTQIARIDVDLSAVTPYSEVGKTVLLGATVLPDSETKQPGGETP